MDRRRRRKSEKEAAGKGAPAASVDELPDDLLGLILLHVDSPLWLIRAASTCKRWRRAVDGADGGAGFLRLARSFHPPAVVGRYLEVPSSVASFVHSSSSTLPPAVRDGFSLHFLRVDLYEWKVIDCHGGLVLLIELLQVKPSLIVCNPLTGRYQGFSCPPGKSGYTFADAFLLDGEDGNTSLSNFRVFCRVYADKDPLVYLFSAADDSGGWRFIRRWADDLDSNCSSHLVGRVDGSLYLGLGNNSSVIVLDNARLEFSMVDLPVRVKKCAYFDYPCQSTFRLVHGGAGGDSNASMTRTSRIVHVYGEDVEVFRRVHDGQWMLERSICRLSCNLEKSVEWVVAEVIGDGTGFFVLSVWDPSGTRCFFSVDVGTMELAVVPEPIYRETSMTITCTLPWPSFMRACLEQRVGRMSKG